MLSGEDSDCFPNEASAYGANKLVHLISRAMCNEPPCPAQLSCWCTTGLEAEPAEGFAAAQIHIGFCPSLSAKVENFQVHDWLNFPHTTDNNEDQQWQALKSSSCSSQKDL